jgi:hypothetical protein
MGSKMSYASSSSSQSQVRSQQQSQDGGPPAVQKLAVPVQATLDMPMLEFINDVDYIPQSTKIEFWGLANRVTGLGKFTQKQAKATILRAENLVDIALMSMPMWAVTPELIMRFENFVQWVKIQVWRATTEDPRHERALIAGQGSFSENRAPPITTPPPRKKIFGIF